MTLYTTFLHSVDILDEDQCIKLHCVLKTETNIRYTVLHMSVTDIRLTWTV